jgi:hypothetical protein
MATILLVISAQRWQGVNIDKISNNLKERINLAPLLNFIRLLPDVGG